ncbi:putative 37s ribosomal protein [Golovinomyces cichoracearum]|uniref:Small ribosomal subunit protein bS18m n=1 Tax=Golovinomyces cichoracearum TaxID=62708 RepID=A0A420J7U3_9PEZI|nr:putative 37s ribosomal protein [Golovinomyces cichoracearum]
MNSMVRPRALCLGGLANLRNRFTIPAASFSTSRVVLFENNDSTFTTQQSNSEPDSIQQNRLRYQREKNSFDISSNADLSSQEINTNPIEADSKPHEKSYARTAGAYHMMKNASLPSVKTADKLKEFNEGKDLSSLIGRQWKAGDVYAPHDLHQAELSKYKPRASPGVDIFDILDMNPLEHYRNFSMMSEWITPMGRIKSRKETALRPVNQRRLAKAIRRSIGIGIMPSVYRHPEILYKERKRYEEESNQIY